MLIDREQIRHMLIDIVENMSWQTKHYKKNKKAWLEVVAEEAKALAEELT